ncbi:MAG: putative acyltransferase [Verrucomicrobiales bacterium]|jgi:predicted acyltransferase
MEEELYSEQGTTSTESKNARLVSLDALRGFDMFWIIGGSGMVVALVKVLGLPESWVSGLASQMTHVNWEGFHFLDLIFPLFVFISGVTVPYSILSKKAKGVPVKQLQIQIIMRSLIIVMIGVSFSLLKFQWEAIRLYQVLWMIGMSYMIGASINLHVESWKYRVVIFFGVLLAYHLAMFYLPYPGKGEEITRLNNLAAWLDRSLIKTNLAWGKSDPEGTIRVFAGGMLGMLGGLVGQRIKLFKQPELRCGAELLTAGVACLLLGWLWSLSFPIIKGLWSSSYVLWSAGWSLLLLALFYSVIDVWKLKWLGWVFVPIGMNAITVYAAQWYLPLHDSRDFFFKGFANLFKDDTIQQLILSSGLVLIQWVILYALYRKKIFIRI